MEAQEIIQRLRDFGYPAEEYADTVQVEIKTRTKINEVTVEEVFAALGNKVSKARIRQVDPWTIVIVP
jgi:hypothetical protein